MVTAMILLPVFVTESIAIYEDVGWPGCWCNSATSELPCGKGLGRGNSDFLFLL